MDKIVIKQHKNNNQYLLTQSGYWIRDFNSHGLPLDINHFVNKNEHILFANNEIGVLSHKIKSLDYNLLPKHDKIIIVSDGCDFNLFKSKLESIPQDVCIIGVNRTLAKWPVNNSTPVRRLNYFINNNPFIDALSYLPKHNYWPNCLVSLKCNPKFISKYKGNLWYYQSTPEKDFESTENKGIRIDEYRNPICAAIHLSKLFRASKLALVCCDDVFKDNRPTAVQLPNGYWMYPQHQISHELIDGMLYWLTNNEDHAVQVISSSNGPEYKHAEYICMDKLMEFFNE